MGETWPFHPEITATPSSTGCLLSISVRHTCTSVRTGEMKCGLKKYPAEGKGGHPEKKMHFQAEPKSQRNHYRNRVQGQEIQEEAGVGSR